MAHGVSKFMPYESTVSMFHNHEEAGEAVIGTGICGVLQVVTNDWHKYYLQVATLHIESRPDSLATYLLTIKGVDNL